MSLAMSGASFWLLGMLLALGWSCSSGEAVIDDGIGASPTLKELQKWPTGEAGVSKERLKCYRCECVVGVMLAELRALKKAKKDDTILIEIRKKKQKVAYPESKMVVEDAVESTCARGHWHTFVLEDLDGHPGRKWYNIEARLEGLRKQDQKKRGKQLKNHCEALVEDHEEAIVEELYANKGIYGVCHDLLQVCPDWNDEAAKQRNTLMKGDL